MVAKLLSKKDLVLIIIILAVGFSALGIRQIRQRVCSQNGIFAEIMYAHGVQTVYLDSDKTFYLPSIPNVLFEVQDGQIAFVKSDCPDQVCVHAGFQGLPGQMAACLPNGLVLSVVKDRPGDDDLDVFVR